MDQYQQTCASCSYWDQKEEEYPIGKCRRHAPTPVLEVFTGEDCDSALWPWTEETEWCGEHRPAVKASSISTMAA